MGAGNGDDRAEMLRRLRLGDLRKLFRHRYGPTLPDDDAGRIDLREMLLPISLAPRANAKMQNVIEVWAPWMQPDEASELLEEITRTPIRSRTPTGRQLGKRQNLTNEQRERLKLWTIAACDMTPAQIKEFRKAKAKARMCKLRQSRGCVVRTQYETNSKSATRPWEKDGISRAQWYRRRKARTNGSGGADQQECKNDHERHQQSGGGRHPRP